MKTRGVITGVGVLSPIGIGQQEFFQSLLAGKSGISRITSFDTTNYRTNHGGEIKNFNPADYAEALPGIGNLERATQLALVAAHEAVLDAGLEINTDNCERIGCVLGSSEGETHCLDNFITDQSQNGSDLPKYELIPRVPTATIYQELAMRFGMKGPCACVATACAAGTNSIGLAFDLIRNGKADVVIAGGVDVFSRLSFSGFNALMSVTRTRCKPFNEHRDGMVLGEAAAIIILERLDHALSRKANIYAELLGYGISNDAYHITSPDPEGNGAKRAIALALEDAGLTADSVQYINAHGTGTPSNDIMEAKVIRDVFYNNGNRVPVSSSKSMFGHTLGAAGSIEFLVCILAIKNGFLPPTINFEDPIKGFEDFDFVPNESRPAEIQVALSNSFAFAGNTSAILVSKFNE